VEYTPTLVLEQELGLSKRVHQHLRAGDLSHQVPTEQNWQQLQLKLEYGRTLILEQELGLKHLHQHLRTGDLSHQVPTEQNWWQWQVEVEYGD
jgi:HAMP domain-containing protein